MTTEQTPNQSRQQRQEAYHVRDALSVGVDLLRLYARAGDGVRPRLLHASGLLLLVDNLRVRCASGPLSIEEAGRLLRGHNALKELREKVKRRRRAHRVLSRSATCLAGC